MGKRAYYGEGTPADHGGVRSVGASMAIRCLCDGTFGVSS